mmetsp:Transcript_19641/g.34785  ORF Transcript_19641/g.34785 Transcript_19641/m.34785 type:complete len:354 (+) Transcript_19641:1259-2320(+)
MSSGKGATELSGNFKKPCNNSEVSSRSRSSHGPGVLDAIPARAVDGAARRPEATSSNEINTWECSCASTGKYCLENMRAALSQRKAKARSTRCGLFSSQAKSQRRLKFLGLSLLQSFFSHSSCSESGFRTFDNLGDRDWKSRPVGMPISEKSFRTSAVRLKLTTAAWCSGPQHRPDTCARNSERSARQVCIPACRTLFSCHIQWKRELSTAQIVPARSAMPMDFNPVGTDVSPWPNPNVEALVENGEPTFDIKTACSAEHGLGATVDQTHRMPDSSTPNTSSEPMVMLHSGAYVDGELFCICHSSSLEPFRVCIMLRRTRCGRNDFGSVTGPESVDLAPNMIASPCSPITALT